MQGEQTLVQSRRIPSPCHAVHARRSVPLQRVEGPAQRVRRDMMQERRQSLLRLPRCCLPYPLGGLGHAFPALCPARAVASRIPLGRGPSLHRLRRGASPLVRPLRRYYGPVRLLHSVHLRLRIPPFPSRPRHDWRGKVKTSQVPVGGLHTCLGSQTPRSSPAPRHIPARAMWPSTHITVSALRIDKFSALNNPARMRRYRRFVPGLTTGNARLAVERGRLLLRSAGLSPATLTPVSLALGVSCFVMFSMFGIYILLSFRACNPPLRPTACTHLAPACIRCACQRCCTGHCPLSSPRAPSRGPSMTPDAAAAGKERDRPLRLPREPRLDPDGVDASFRRHRNVPR